VPKGSSMAGAGVPGAGAGVPNGSSMAGAGVPGAGAGVPNGSSAAGICVCTPVPWVSVLKDGSLAPFFFGSMGGRTTEGKVERYASGSARTSSKFRGTGTKNPRKLQHHRGPLAEAARMSTV